MTRMIPLKTLGFSLLAASLIGGTAAADDCKDKTHTSMIKSESTAATAVLPASAERAYPAKKTMKAYTFDEALAKLISILKNDKQYVLEYQAYVLSMCFGKEERPTFEQVVTSLSEYQRYAK